MSNDTHCKEYYNARDLLKLLKTNNIESYTVLKTNDGTFNIFSINQNEIKENPNDQDSIENTNTNNTSHPQVSSKSSGSAYSW